MTYNYNNSLLGDYLSPSGEHLVVENPIVIQSGSINNTTIGNSIPSSGYFSNLSVNGTGVSLTGHTHVVTDITDFNSSVNGLLPVINNSGDNRILTSDGTSSGINAENRLTYSADRRNALVVAVADSSGVLDPAKTCVLLNASLITDPSSVSATIGNCETISQLSIPSGSTINNGSLFGFAVTIGRNIGSGDAGVMGGSSSLIPFSAGYGHFPFGGEENDPVTNTVIGLNLVPFAGAGTINTHYAILIQNVASGVLDPVPIFGSGNIINSYGIFQKNFDPNILNGNLTVNNGLSAPTPILSLGSVSGNVSISYGVDKQIQKLTLNGTATNLIKGSDWPTTFSADVLLEITVSSTTTVSFSIVDDWYNPVPSFIPGKYLVLLRSMGSIIQGHYIGNKTN